MSPRWLFWIFIDFIILLLDFCVAGEGNNAMLDGVCLLAKKMGLTQ